MKKKGFHRRSSRRAPYTPHVVRDWQGGDTPFATEQNLSEASDLLGGILDRYDLNEGVQEDQIKKSWQKIAGEFVAQQTEIVALKNGLLTLRVLQPAMRFHLQQSQVSLLRKVQEELGKKTIRSIRLVTG